MFALLHYGYPNNEWGEHAMRTFLEKIRGLREDNDLTQTQIAEVLGTSQTMYARYERGANEMPIHHLITLCKFYNVSADYLLGIEADKCRDRGKCLPSFAAGKGGQPRRKAASPTDRGC